MVYIYGLKCPVAGVIRYVGKSINPQKRLIAHLTGARTGAYKHHTSAWLRKVIAGGLLPELVILEEVQSGQDWRAVERRWIEKARIAGWPLTNTTAGGEGLDYLDPEDMAAYKANHRAAMKRLAATLEGQAGIRKMTEGGSKPEAQAKRISALRQAWTDPQKRANWDAARERMARDPETQRKRAEALQANWAANRDEMVAKIWTPATRAKQSAGRVASWADPETRERLMNRWTPEARAKQAEELATRQAKIQAARTPEVRAKQAAALKATWAKRKAEKQLTAEFL